MLTKQTAIDQITVTEKGAVLYREATKIMEDGQVLTQTYHRTSLLPGDDLTNQPQKVKDICNTVWTPEIISAWNAEVAARNNG